MLANVINVSAFQGDYKIGLIFSLLDGLKMGHTIDIVCDNEIKDLEILLAEASIPNVSWSSMIDNESRRHLILTKDAGAKTSQGGCCGMCGG